MERKRPPTGWRGVSGGRGGEGGTDAGLIARALAGEESAFEMLVERYGGRCVRLAGHFLADREEAAEAAQEALANAFLHLRRYDASRPFWPWLARMVVNAAIDRLRSANRRGALHPGEVLEQRPSTEAPPEEVIARDELRRRVHRVLATLPEKYRTVLILREMEGMSAEEIGRVLGRPAATVRWRLFKARGMFRRAWEGRG